MEGSLIVTGKIFAMMIKNATDLPPSGFEESAAEACMECPNCKHCIHNNDTSSQWPGLPAGVKFDPSDLELLQHLEGKVGIVNSESHVLIDDFIPTIAEVDGICYTHPENLPGIKRDGSSNHFFHRISNAYNCGKRKRRKISYTDHTVRDEHMRWHKTGRSLAILDNGVMKGWRKILVLHKGSKEGGGNVEKANWTMHQYHLGVEENEKDGELVVSKVFRQLPSNKTEKSKMYGGNIEHDIFSMQFDPSTPKTYPPQPPRANSCPGKTRQIKEGEETGSPRVQLKAEVEELTWCAVTSQTVVDAALPDLDEHPACTGILDARHEGHETTLPAPHGISELDSLWDTLPDLSTLADLQFLS